MTYHPMAGLISRLSNLSNAVDEAEDLYTHVLLRPTYRDCASCLAKKHDEQQC
jgi:hypothetical protein